MSEDKVLAIELCEALGIDSKNTQRITIDVGTDNIFVVHVTMFDQEEKLAQIVSRAFKERLQEIND